jgi:hypothetical protein
MTPLAYHAMRMRWCRAALWAFVRRWGIYMVVAAAVLAGGSSGALASVQALCAWLVLPLFRAAVEPVWLVPAVALQALLGAGLVWGMRPLLWPLRWAATERALPIARRDLMVSDSVVVALGLTPLVVLYAVGAQALVARDPAWLRPALAAALGGLGVAILGSLALGVALLRSMRRAGLPRPSAAANRASPALRVAPALEVAPTRAAGWIPVLLWWPLWRGPARRSGRMLWIGIAALCVPSLGLLRWPHAGPWWLAAYAALALLVVTRLNGLAGLELAGLLQACQPLPLRPARLQRGRAGLALVPLVPSGGLLLACLPLAAVRPLVLGAYGAACLASCAVEVSLVQNDAADKSSRWLFCLVLMLALASEVMR